MDKKKNTKDQKYTINSSTSTEKDQKNRAEDITPGKVREGSQKLCGKVPAGKKIYYFMPVKQVSTQISHADTKSGSSRREEDRYKLLQ